MSTYEDDIIILLRKIVAMAISKSFEATEDTYRLTLMEKLKFEHKSLFIVCNDFIKAFELRYLFFEDKQLKIKNEDEWQLQYEKLDKVFKEQEKSLLQECKLQHINIDYELNKLIENGNTGE